jgi:hypothetical protein
MDRMRGDNINSSRRSLSSSSRNDLLLDFGDNI